MNTKQPTLDHRKLYRLPWSLPDNAQAWLEPTKKCNLSCLACFRENDPNSHKSLEEVRCDLDVFRRYRTMDSLLIAGGEPLLHPEIVEIVAMVARVGLKPIVVTNGLALTPELLSELKHAGVVGFVFHIDSKQGRPGWKDKDEVELNQLRLYYAEMVADAGDICCSFHVTVFEDTLQLTPEIVDWAQSHIDIVQAVAFIPVRLGFLDGTYDHYVNGELVDFSELPYSKPGEARHEIQSTDIVTEIQKRFPDFAPAAYLNGTEAPDSLKWLLTVSLGTRKRVYGYIGPRSMEMIQVFHHLTTGKYLAYSKPALNRLGRMSLALSLFDRRLRDALRRYLDAVTRRPWRLRDRLFLQSVMIVQPLDIYADGRQNMCEGCPDMTIWNGRLVWSCRIEEPERFGDFAQFVPREGEA